MGIKIKRKILTSAFAATLTLTALIVWFISLFQTSPSNINDIGLMGALPITFFVAFVLLTTSFLIALKCANKNQALLLLQILILVCFLSLTPTIVEGTRARYSYPTYGFVDYIIRNGQLNPSLVYYHNWPGIIIVLSGLVNIGGISPLALISSFPVVPELLYIVPVTLFSFLFIKNTEQRWMTIWSFFIIAWTGQDFLSPQAFEFFVYLLVSTVLIFEASSDKRRPTSRSFLVLISLLVFSVVMSHFLTALMLVGIMGVLLVFKKLKRVNLLLLSTLIVVAWTIYGATAYFDSNVPSFLSQAFKFNEIFSSSVSQRTTGSWGHILTVYDRLFFTAIAIGLAGVGFIFSWRTKKLNVTDKTVLIALTGVALFAFILPYGGELYLRLLLFSSILLAYFISKNLGSKKTFTLLIIFLLVAPFFHIVATYGDEKFDYIPPGELQGAHFFESHVPDAYVIAGAGGTTWVDYIGSYDHYASISLGDGNLSTTEAQALMQRINSNKYWPIYLMFTSGDTAFLTLFDNDTRFINQTQAQIQNIPRYDLFYSNPNMQLYTYNPNK